MIAHIPGTIAMNESHVLHHVDGAAQPVRSGGGMHVAIIGGGFCGVMVATHLLTHARRDDRLLITLIEPRAQLGGGAAFGSQRESDLLNVPAGKMSAFPDQPRHFLDWLGATGRTYSESSFVPRGLFGEYIRWNLSRTTLTAPEHVKLVRLDGHVTAVRPGGSHSFAVAIDSADTLTCDAVVLATGLGDAHRPPGIPQAIMLSERFVANPWSPDAIRAVGKSERVLMVGTGLTMLDTAIALHRQGHEAPMIAVSRRGTTPAVHAPSGTDITAPNNWPARAVENASSLRSLRRAIREAVKEVEAGHGNWRVVVDALRPHKQALWQALPLRDRDRFMEHLLPYWERARHRCAPEVGAAIEVLRSRGVLDVRAARIEHASEVHGEIHVRVRRRGCTTSETWIVDRIINCTGPESDIRRSDHPLLQQLLRDGVAVPGPLNIGFATIGGEIRSASGDVLHGFFTLGALRKGELWESTAVPELRVQARQVADALLRRLADGSPAVSATPLESAS